MIEIQILIFKNDRYLTSKTSKAAQADRALDVMRAFYREVYPNAELTFGLVVKRGEIK